MNNFNYENPINEIRSIGWLKGIDDTVILTPCFNNNPHGLRVRISKEEFEAVRHDEQAMKELAIKKLF